MRRRIGIAACVVIVFGLSLHAQDASPLPRTEGREFTSKTNGLGYQVFVSLPATYATNTSATFPVIYLADANWTFALTVQTYQILRLGNQMPEAIFVGIVRAGVDDTGPVAGPPRTLDLTPTTVADFDRDATKRLNRDIRSGGAPAFLRVIRDELVPDVERRYRTNGDRTFIGYSLSGLFGAYALFHSPDTFKRMILVSPSFWWDSNVSSKFEETYAAAHKSLPVRLFMSDGELEGSDMLGTMRKMASALTDRHYPDLDLHTRIFEGENHTSTFPVAVTRGLKTVFAEIQKP
jgi:predicted alpha/beta superfamily hydrolase